MYRREFVVAAALVTTGGCLRLQDSSATGQQAGQQTRQSGTVESAAESETRTPASADAVELSRVWQTRLDEVGVHDGRIYGVAPGNGQEQITAVDVQGAEQWAGDRIDEELTSESLVVTDETVFVGAGSRDRGDRSGMLYAFATGDGSTEWTFQVANGRASPVVVGPDAVYCGTDDIGHSDDQEPVVYALDRADGSVRWSHDDLPAAFVNAISVRESRVFVGLDNNIHVFDRASGSRLDTVNLPVRGWTDDNPVLYANSVSGVRAYDTAAGEERWYTETVGNVKSQPVLVGDLVVAGTESGLAAFDRETGDIRWETSTQLAIDVTPVAWRGYVWAGDDEGQIYGFRRSDGELVYQSGYPENRIERALATTPEYLIAGGTAYELSEQ